MGHLSGAVGPPIEAQRSQRDKLLVGPLRGAPDRARRRRPRALSERALCSGARARAQAERDPHRSLRADPVASRIARALALGRGACRGGDRSGLDSAERATGRQRVEASSGALDERAGATLGALRVKEGEIVYTLRCSGLNFVWGEAVRVLRLEGQRLESAGTRERVLPRQETFGASPGGRGRA